MARMEQSFNSGLRRKRLAPYMEVMNFVRSLNLEGLLNEDSRIVKALEVMGLT